MAGYPKIWTTIRHESWFKSLSCLKRGIWLQVILIAKEQSDDGWLCFNNVSHFAAELRSDRSSCEAWLTTEAQQLRINCVEKSKQLLRFQITNYNSSQSVTRFSDLKNASVTKLKGTELNGKEIKEYPRQVGEPDEKIKGKKTDPVYNLKWEYLNKRFNQIIGQKAPGSVIGQILKWADNIGDAVTTLYKIKTWTAKPLFMGAVRKTLNERQSWSDENFEMVKNENTRFEEWLAQTHGTTVGRVL